MKLKALAEALGAALSGDGGIEITGVAGLEDVSEGLITFAANDRLQDLARSAASAAIVAQDAPVLSLPLLRVKNPKLAFAKAIGLFYGKPSRAAGISDKAVIGRDVEIGAGASIGPYVVIEDHVRLGDRVTLFPGVFIGEGSVLGDDSVVYANVSIREGVTVGKRAIIHAGAVIGSDGFGFVTDGGRHHKIPQVGGVVIEDDVEIGANSAVDRATLGNTLIKQGTKIDNMVQIGHNVTVGEHNLLAGQAAIGGSTKLGKYVVLGGQAGVADHVVIGDGVMAGGGSGINNDIAPGTLVSGYYAMPIKDWLRVQAILPKLPDLRKRVAELERKLNALQDPKKTS